LGHKDVKSLSTACATTKNATLQTNLTRTRHNVEDQEPRLEISKLRNLETTEPKPGFLVYIVRVWLVPVSVWFGATHSLTLPRHYLKILLVYTESQRELFLLVCVLLCHRKSFVQTEIFTNKILTSLDGVANTGFGAIIVLEIFISESNIKKYLIL